MILATDILDDLTQERIIGSLNLCVGKIPLGII